MGRENKKKRTGSEILVVKMVEMRQYFRVRDPGHIWHPPRTSARSPYRVDILWPSSIMQPSAGSVIRCMDRSYVQAVLMDNKLAVDNSESLVAIQWAQWKTKSDRREPGWQSSAHIGDLLPPSPPRAPLWTGRCARCTGLARPDDRIADYTYIAWHATEYLVRN